MFGIIEQKNQIRAELKKILDDKKNKLDSTQNENSKNCTMETIKDISLMFLCSTNGKVSINANELLLDDYTVFSKSHVARYVRTYNLDISSRKHLMMFRSFLENEDLGILSDYKREKSDLYKMHLDKLSQILKNYQQLKYFTLDSEYLTQFEEISRQIVQLEEDYQTKTSELVCYTKQKALKQYSKLQQNMYSISYYIDNCINSVVELFVFHDLNSDTGREIHNTNLLLIQIANLLKKEDQNDFDLFQTHHDDKKLPTAFSVNGHIFPYSVLFGDVENFQIHYYNLLKDFFQNKENDEMIEKCVNEENYNYSVFVSQCCLELKKLTDIIKSKNKQYDTQLVSQEFSKEVKSTYKSIKELHSDHCLFKKELYESFLQKIKSKILPQH
ncbi:hypothetical protein AB837_00557 [bacterium AB1]|nr:hypothetical protein AB837_00557 [bacterium AB1]